MSKNQRMKLGIESSVFLSTGPDASLHVVTLTSMREHEFAVELSYI